MSLMVEGGRPLRLLGGVDRYPGDGLLDGAFDLDRGRFRLPCRGARGWRHRPVGLPPTPVAGGAGLVPSGLINTLFCKAFNEAWYRKAPVERRDALMDHRAVLPPARHGLGLEPGLRTTRLLPVAVRRATRRATWFAVRSNACRGRASPRSSRCSAVRPGQRLPLSFPTKGWTLAFDTAVQPGLERLFDELDQMVVEAGRSHLPGQGLACAARAGARDVPAHWTSGRGARTGRSAAPVPQRHVAAAPALLTSSAQTTFSTEDVQRRGPEGSGVWAGWVGALRRRPPRRSHRGRSGTRCSPGRSSR